MGCDGGIERIETTGTSLEVQGEGADAGDEVGCDLVDGWGCRPAEKCALPTGVAPRSARGVCVAEGSARAEEPCALDLETGVDDCMRGLHCADGVCKEICRVAPDSCPAQRYCATLGGRLGDEGVGLCEPACDLFAQDCDAGESCYLALGERDFAAICAPAFPEPPPAEDGCGLPGATRAGTTGDCCSYVNTCAPGYACVRSLAGASEREGVCAFVCDPTGARGDAPSECDPPGPGPSPDYVCTPLRELAAAVADLPSTIGVCVDSAHQ